MAKHHLQMVVSFLLASSLTACGGSGGSGSIPGTLNASGSSSNAITSQRMSSTQLQSSSSAIAIDAGGGATGNWIADTDFNNGWTNVTVHPIDVSHVTNAAPQAVYQSQRASATMLYAIPGLVPNALYSVRLHLAETWFTSSGKRVFGVSINGTQVLNNFDIFAAAGGSNIAVVKQFSTAADANGKISIAFASTVDNASIGGIEIISNTATPAPPSSPTPTSGVSIDAGGSATGSWVADTGFGGGSVAVVPYPINTSHVQNPAPQSVYQSQRWAHDLSYTIANLSAGAGYLVRLHFCESYWGGAGQRIFGASINGNTILSNFDIYRTAGAMNTAVIKEFSANADSTGKIRVTFSSSVNNASIAGIEVIPGTSATPTPRPTPSPTNPPSNGKYPIYSSYFTGNTPFHHTVSQLMAAGAVVLPNKIAQNYWAEGFGTTMPAVQSGGVGPLYTVSSGDPAYRFTCPTWGACDANGMIAHFPAGAYPQTGSDHHLNSFDPVYLHGEIDGWGGDGDPNHACNLNSGNPGTASCSWGGFYPFNGDGLAQAGNSGDAGGYAFGLMDISAGELLQGHIDHALGIEESCLDDGGVYPSTIGRTSDAHCPSNLEPNAKYGQMIHLKSSVNVASLGYSHYCAVIVQALQTYGAYTADNNGSWGLALNVEFMNQYSGSNPWYTTIMPSMVAGGDGSGSGSGFNFNTCLQRIPAQDIEVIQISPNLPS